MQPWSMKDERVKKENFPHETNLIFIWFVHILPSVKYAHVFVHELNKYVKFYGRQCNKKEHQEDPWIWKKCQEWFIEWNFLIQFLKKNSYFNLLHQHVYGVHWFYVSWLWRGRRLKVLVKITLKNVNICACINLFHNYKVIMLNMT